MVEETGVNDVVGAVAKDSSLFRDWKRWRDGYPLGRAFGCVDPRALDANGVMAAWPC